ncbi:MAG: flagellar hook assembly protein FlgD [Chitinivibrionia bacterium]|nr:flagellar hook assembly protein FlgD [Chitinivibrionia bacterium]
MVSQTLNSLMRQTEAHSITASIDRDGGSISTTRMTGDRTSGLFAAQAGMGQLDFLTLLTTQLQYQDPLSPMENTDFVAQLAQFSQLESTTSMQQSMEEMAQRFGESMDLQTFNSQSTTNAAAVSLVGKEVRLRQNTFEHSRNDGPREFSAHIGERSNAILTIVNSDLEVVRTIRLEGKDDTNTVRFTWDGTDDRGQRVPSGTYNLMIEGQHDDESLYTFVEDFVTGIRYTNQGTMIRVSGVELPIGDILEVKHPSVSNGGSTSSSLSMGQALALIGFETRILREETIGYEPRPNGEVKFQIDLGGAPSTQVIVRDSAGREVHRQTVLATQLSSNGEFEMPTRSYSGSDRYTIEVSGNGARLFQSGTITGITNKNGVPIMVVQTANGRVEVDATKILSLTAPKNQEEDSENSA